MGTMFEIVLCGDDPLYLHSAGEEALLEIQRIDRQLSFYREESEVSDLNARAASEPVTVDPRLFELLVTAKTLNEQSDGAFDITVAPLLRCWGFVGASGKMPSEADVAKAREVTGMTHVLLEPADHSVRFDRDGVQLDFGAIGKGYAIECAVELLRENGIESALVHGGTSTIYALGSPPHADSWEIAIRYPFSDEMDRHLAKVALRDEAMSVSAPHGKWFESGGKRYGHVIDPRTGRPAGRSLLSALITPSATDSDALSTALLTNGPDWLQELVALRPGCRALVASEGENAELQIAAQGIDV